MAYISVSNTLVNGNVADATQVNTNFTEITGGLSDGTKDLNMNNAAFGGTLGVTGVSTFTGTADCNGKLYTGSDVHYEDPPIAMYDAPKVAMVWKDAATITLQAGIYFVNQRALSLAVDTDWSWTMDDGGAGDVASTWYYLYVYDNSGTPAFVASATAPTAKFNTGLSGATYDTNTYLGAFYNDSGQDIDRFVHNSGIFMFMGAVGEVTHNTDVFSAKTIRIPATANYAYLHVSAEDAASGLHHGYVSADNSTDFTTIYAGIVGAAGVRHTLLMPIITAQTIYLRIDGGANGADLVSARVTGWIDKWI